MDRKEIVEILEKQLRLLSENSRWDDTADLSRLTDSMIQVSAILLALQGQQNAVPKLVLDREAMARYFVDRNSGASTKELVDELRTRDGVETHVVGPNASMTVEAEGPATPPRRRG